MGEAWVKISGKITDNHNNILPDISVSILNSYDGATSDSSGNYSFITSEKKVFIFFRPVQKDTTHLNKI